MPATRTKPLHDFLEKWCERTGTDRILRARLFESYKVFCILTKQHCLPPDEFVTSLKDLGLRFEENDVVGIDLANDFTAWALQTAQEREVQSAQRRDV